MLAADYLPLSSSATLFSRDVRVFVSDGQPLYDVFFSVLSLSLTAGLAPIHCMKIPHFSTHCKQKEKHFCSVL